MAGRLVTAAVLAIGISVFGAIALAQNRENDDRNELSGVMGRIFISDQGIQGATFFNPVVHSGKGLTFEINYARRFFGSDVYSLSGEIPGVFNLDEDLNSGSNVVPRDYQQIFLTPSLRLNLFPHTAVSPWVSFGGGLAHFSENENLLYGGPNPGGSTTSGALQAGIGVDERPFKVRFPHLGFRGEAREFWSGTPDLPLAPTGKSHQFNCLVGGGVVWHF